MARARQLAVRSVVIALAMAAWCVPCATDAQRASLRVAVGEIGANDGGPAAARALSRALVEALEQQPAIDVASPGRAELVVRGSVSRLEQRAVSGGLEVSCEVSLIVADRGGSIRAMLRGRGGARGGADADRLSSDAMRAAVRGALRPLATQGPALAR